MLYQSRQHFLLLRISHLWPFFPFYTSWEHQKPFGFFVIFRRSEIGTLTKTGLRKNVEQICVFTVSEYFVWTYGLPWTAEVRIYTSKYLLQLHICCKELQVTQINLVNHLLIFSLINVSDSWYLKSWKGKRSGLDMMG